MTKLFNCGITIDVPENEVAFYQRAGYEKVVEGPVEIPARFEQTTPPIEKPVTPEEVWAAPVKKVVKRNKI